VPDENVTSLLERAEGFESRPEDWMMMFALSEEEITEMEDAEFLVEGLIISCQINIIAAKPGAGKTSILMEELGRAVKAGCRVSYVNMDCGAGDVKFWSQKAKENGFTMITPHFQGGDGIERWMAGLERMADGHTDLSKLVIVVDTLKKIADLMSKAKVKAVMSLLRALTAQKATIACAAHCNKQSTHSGELQYEGTGDVEGDCDNLIYLESSRDEQSGVRTTSTYPSDKVRGIFKRRSWHLHEDRSVDAAEEFIDVKVEADVQTQAERDVTYIQLITEGIRAGKQKRTDLWDYCHGRIPRRSFDNVLKRYSQGLSPAKVVPLWKNTKQVENNSDYYTMI
jgi:hypothetical protein